LGRDRTQLWNASDPTKVKDYNQCLDFIDTVLDGYMLSAICEEFCPGQPGNVDQLRLRLPYIDSQTVEAKLMNLAKKFSCYGEVDSVRAAPSVQMARDECYSNYFLFMQHALTMKLFLRAMKKGDSGLMMNAFSILSIYFQASESTLYARECLRLTADLREIWSPALRKYYLENCLVNISGKPNAFLAVDALNEHIVREAKSFLSGNQTKATIEYAQTVKTPLIMILSEIKRVVDGELGTWGRDVKSSSANPWPDIEAVANRLLLLCHTKPHMSRSSEAPRVVEDLFDVGWDQLSSTERISAVISTYTSIADDEEVQSDEELDEEQEIWSDVEEDDELELEVYDERTV
jgi:hypothetical protein